MKKKRKDFEATDALDYTWVKEFAECIETSDLPDHIIDLIEMYKEYKRKRKNEEKKSH